MGNRPGQPAPQLTWFVAITCAVVIGACRSVAPPVSTAPVHGSATARGFFSRLCRDQPGPWFFPSEGCAYACADGRLTVSVVDLRCDEPAGKADSLERGARKYDLFRGDAGSIEWSDRGCRHSFHGSALHSEDETPGACRAVQLLDGPLGGAGD